MKDPKDRITYFHDNLNQEVQAIGGRYVLTEEKQLQHDNHSILYLTGHAVFDSTCCGTGGCVYAVVYGYIVAWRQKRPDGDGYVTQTNAIRNQATQEEIRQEILKKEKFIQQVIFLPA